MTIQYFLTCAIAVGVTGALLWVLRHLALRIGLVDHPGERKQHVGDIALIGGIAMFCGLMLSALTLEGSLGGYRAFFAAAALLVIVGILDDFHELPAWSRFVAQFVAALIMTLGGGVVVTDLGAIVGSGPVSLGEWSVPFTVFAVVGVINAFNMLDGADGLAGSVALVALSLFAYVAWAGGRNLDAAILGLLLCTVLVFLVFNARIPGRSQALVFMGDAGSMLLGFVLAWFAVSLSQSEQRAMAPACTLWILAIPLLDTVGILVRRIGAGRSPFLAATDHMHHLMFAAGLSVNKTVGLVGLSALLFGLGGVLAMQAGITESVLFGAFLLLFLLHLWIVSVVSASVSAVGRATADQSKPAPERQELPPSQ
jgi:UDP-GlcNAc:undecaprenyl-phosphate GlcNAc-1-phosphate transferase